MCTDCDLRSAHKVYLCLPCRKVWKCAPYSGRVVSHRCPKCGKPGSNMGYQWRAPKLTNKKAWKLIESGDFYWDKRAVAKNPRSQRDQALKEYWDWVARKVQRKRKSVIPDNFRRKFL